MNSRGLKRTTGNLVRFVVAAICGILPGASSFNELCVVGIIPAASSVARAASIKGEEYEEI